MEELSDNQLNKEIERTQTELEALGDYFLSLQDERFRRYFQNLIGVRDGTLRTNSEQ